MGSWGPALAWTDGGRGFVRVFPSPPAAAAPPPLAQSCPCRNGRSGGPGSPPPRGFPLTPREVWLLISSQKICLFMGGLGRSPGSRGAFSRGAPKGGGHRICKWQASHLLLLRWRDVPLERDPLSFWERNKLFRERDSAWLPQKGVLPHPHPHPGEVNKGLGRLLLGGLAKGSQ